MKYYFYFITRYALSTFIASLFFAFFFSPFVFSDFQDKDWPRTVIDTIGRECVVPSPPKRIVPLFSGNTELVSCLGLANLIVGIDARTFYPPGIDKLPKVGSRLGVSLEQIVAKKPDLVIVTPSSEVPNTLLSTLTRLGIPNLLVTSRTIAEIEDNIRKVAYLSGVEENAEIVINDMEERLLKVKIRREGKTKPRVVLISSKLPSGLFGVIRKGNYTGQIVELAGGILALDENVSGPRVPQISPEALIALNPDIIIVIRRRDQGGDIYDYLQKPAFSQLRAQLNKQIFELPSAGFLIPATRVLDGVEQLCDIFDAWDNM
jgi:iron complex transport system substrate-binding protein